MSSLNKMTKKGTGTGIYFHLKLLYVLIFTMVVVISYNIWFQYNLHMKHDDMELNRIFMEISRSLKSPNTENESEELKIVRTEILEFLTQGDIKNDLSKIGRGKRQTSGSRSGEIDDMITDVSVSILILKVYNYYIY